MGRMASSPKVLVVEDNAGHRTLLDLLLSPSGYDITMVEDAREALAWLQGNTPDLAILDVDIPQMTGLQIAERMRKISRLKETKIIVLTALRDDGTREMARMVKAEALVLKPLQGKDFRAIVESILAGEKIPI